MKLHVNNNDTSKVKSSWVLPVALIVINGVYEIEIETNVGEEEIYINKKNGNIIAEKEFELIKMKMMMTKMKTIWIMMI